MPVTIFLACVTTPQGRITIHESSFIISSLAFSLFIIITQWVLFTSGLNRGSRQVGQLPVQARALGLCQPHSTPEGWPWAQDRDDAHQQLPERSSCLQISISSFCPARLAERLRQGFCSSCLTSFLVGCPSNDVILSAVICPNKHGNYKSPWPCRADRQPSPGPWGNRTEEASG